MNHVHCVPSDCTISVQFMYIFYTFCTLYIERHKRTVDVRRRRTSTTKVVKAVSVGSQRLFVFETSSLPRLSEDAAARTKSKRALVGWFVGSKVGLGWWLFLRCFVASFLRSFVPSFLRSFVPSFLRSFVRLSVAPRWLLCCCVARAHDHTTFGEVMRCAWCDCFCSEIGWLEVGP